MNPNDRQSILANMTEDNSSILLRNASPELQADREVVMAAVINNPHALKFASPELHADREFILAAVTNNGEALKYASPELKYDREVGLAANYQIGQKYQDWLQGYSEDM